MYKGKCICAIITAGGNGTRMESQVPKQYLPIAGVPMIRRTATVFDECDAVDCIAVTAPQEHLQLCRALLADVRKRVLVVTGGKQRQDSVANALRELNSSISFDYVIIHDGARPYVTEEMLMDSLEKALETGAAVAAVPVKDTIRSGAMTLQRDNLYIVQTPQTFEKSIILRAHEKAASDAHYGSDDGGLVERLGLPVALSQGDYANIKITTKEDLPPMQRIGKGYDAHRLIADRPLVLGGVTIAHPTGLAGHSDADVLVHAIIDALLGAAALGDIGRHFPDTDSAYAGISSIVLLQRTQELLAAAGNAIVNVDATVIAEAPKLASHIDEMRANIADALRIDKCCVGIKATTTEGLGFAGRKEGIAADAVCLISKIY